MPIFISYSRKDSDFVETLALNLIRKKHNVWLDKWELNVGDSLIEKIQTALIDSSAIIVILSKNSINSDWCKKELNAALMREIEERKSLLIPCIIDDCSIPLFLRDKLYADFSKNKDEALKSVDKALSKYVNALQGRIDNPDFFTDWSIAYGDISRNELSYSAAINDGIAKFIEITFVDHSEKWNYIVLNQWIISFIMSQSENRIIFMDEAKRENFIKQVINLLCSNINLWTTPIFIDSPNPKKEFHKIRGVDNIQFHVELACRRLGSDNGMDTLYYVENNLMRCRNYMEAILRGA